jgi:UDP-hydrolysing UDP-N-acetyl-D-glucosamine 2-epimerase
MKSNKKVCVFIGSRANYSSIKSAMVSIKKHSNLELQVILGSSAVLERFGKVSSLIEKDGFIPDYIFYNNVEGENPVTMAKSTGLGIIEVSTILNNLNPDVVIVVGDRFEMMSITIASAYMNIPIAHTMGGEVTGTIDESIRHAITKFSHIHFVSNSDSGNRVIKMGENSEYVFNVGCPRIDLVKDELLNNSAEVLSNLFDKHVGVGSNIELNLDKGFLLVSQHPVTTEYGDGRRQIEETLKALGELKMPTIMLWPNIDAGSDDISKGIRTFREEHNPEWLYIFKNLPINIYIHLMNQTLCLIGNSSSGIREGSYIGTPVVNIGSRQNKRLKSSNVIQVSHNAKDIIKGVKYQINAGKYPVSDIYGDGDAGNKIANLLYDVDLNIQKTISY